MITRRQIAELKQLALEEGDRRREAALATMKCDRCDDEGIAWRCPKCGHPLCGDCLFSQIDCYDLARRCPACGDPLPDSDGSGPVDWKVLGYVPGNAA